MSTTKILIIVVMTMLVNLVNSRVVGFVGLGRSIILPLCGGDIYNVHKNFHLLSN